ncbi:3-oxoacyl-ACP synthase [Bacillus sp. Marseille-P3800]|uniref:3-oxoacyl-ACP synthase n=1 Tax=Bacillus sp. Marseille-P3800 TaxID=2014782 RepID=UPI000C08D73C|nr:3-oxoacyl-ACP synthase [Bacillus sp. Marseille-P3800]
MTVSVGIAGLGLYIPEHTVDAAYISEQTKGVWTEEAVRTKLGIHKKTVPGIDDGTQEMGVKAAEDALRDGKIDAREIDLILCIGEEWKEYPLTTSAIYIQEKIGANRAWAIDVQQRCCSCISAMKMAKAMMSGDETLKTVLIAGGYRNGDLVDYEDPTSSMLYNLSAGGGAMILKRNHPYNEVLGSYVMTDGTMARDAGVEIGGTVHPIDEHNFHEAHRTLKLMRPAHMKNRLNDVSMKNWFFCIDNAMTQSGLTRDAIDYLGILHMKPSMHHYMLEALELFSEQTTYLSDYGHMGQIDQILSLKLGLQEGKIKPGSTVALVAAGIGYAWAACAIRWGPREEKV